MKYILELSLYTGVNTLGVKHAERFPFQLRVRASLLQV